MRSIALGILLIASSLPAQQRGITSDDYLSFELVSDPRISPDGSKVVYVVQRVDRAANRRVPSVWIAPTDGSAPPKVLIDESITPSAPRWMPDGQTVAFVSRGQLNMVPFAGGAPRKVTSVMSGLSGCVISPNGMQAACLSRTGPSDKWPAGKERSDVRHYRRINYKFNDTGWFDDKRSHIWIVDVASGGAKQITEGDDWNDTDPQWSPNSQRIAFVSDRTGHEFDLGRNTDVWTIPASGCTQRGPSGASRPEDDNCLTKISTAPGPDNQPRWSPDGNSIAFVTAAGEEQPPQIAIAPANGGASVTPYPALDLIPTDLQYAKDGSLFFDTGVKGEFHVFKLNPSAHTLTQVTSGARAVRSPSLSADGKTMVFLANDFECMDDVYAASIDAKNEKQLSKSNAELMSKLNLAKVERFTFKGAENWDVDGFLVKPLGFQPGKKYPLILSIHGGPAGQYGVDWYHEFQVYAAKGWGVLFMNPRGSTGYGRKFQRGIEKQWGGNDYIDIMNGVNAAIKANPWIDTTKMGVTGGSYGGYMTNWIVGHTNRFKAAVTLRSISNFLSDDATRDAAYGHKDDFGGDIFQQEALYWDRSPLKYVKNVQTPILILHSDNDFRVPIEQAEQWYRALKWMGKPAEIVFFPRENHNLTRTGEPKHLVASLDWQTYWFSKYLDGNASLLPPNER